MGVKYAIMESIDRLDINNFKFNSTSHAINFYLSNCKNISNIDEKIETNSDELTIWKGKDVFAALVIIFNRYLTELPSKEKHIFLETEVYKNSIKQVASELKCSRHNIYRILNKNRAKLEEILKEFDLL